MKKLKNMIALLLAVLLVFSLAACGSSASTAAEQSQTADASDNSENTESNVPGDFPGETPPDKPDGNGGSGGAPGGSSADIDYTASVEITSGDSQSGQTYASTTADESALLISTSDEVTITNLWETLTYKVCEIRVIEPNDIDAVLIQPGRDMLTLITCHPYASGGRYRLVIYCERAETEREPQT